MDDASIKYLFGAPVGLILLAWLAVAVVAAWVAPDRRLTFFLITAFFLGPIGIAAAAIAQPRTNPVVPRPALLARITSTVAGSADTFSATSQQSPLRGDKVKVEAPGDEHDGRTGTVEGIKDGWVWVKFSVLGSTYGFKPDQLKVQ